MMSAQVTNFSAKSPYSVISRLAKTLSRIFLSTAIEGYSCSTVIGNLSRKASFKMLVPIKRPSSEPLPLVLAVAKTLKPTEGETNLFTFLRNTPLPSSTGCKHIILEDAKSISSRRSIAPRSMALTTGPSCQTVLPSINA